MAGCVRQSISGIDQWERIMKKKKKFCFTKKNRRREESDRECGSSIDGIRGPTN